MKICAALIGLQTRELEQVEQSLIAFPDVRIARRLQNYPGAGEMAPLLRAVDPDLLFVSTQAPAEMEAALEEVARSSPNVQVVLVDSTARPAPTSLIK